MVGHHGRRSSQDSSILMRVPERRRSSSQDDTMPRGGVLQAANSADASAGNASADPHPSKRLGFLSEKLLSSASGSPSIHRISPGGLHVRTHARSDSASNGASRDTAPSPVPSMTTSPNQAKSHISPNKVSSSTRTYDSKLVSREMHRLGTLAHIPLAPTLAASAQSVAAHNNMAASAASNTAAGPPGDPWQTLHIHILPLFNGEPLRVPIEDLNQLVKRHIQTAVSAAPSKALATLEQDAAQLISAGMVTLNAKLSSLENDKLIVRVGELWVFFWGQVLPYVEGALLPLQTEPLLSSLYRVPKGHKSNTSPIAGGNGKGSMSSIMLQSTPQIDVRTIALHAFRDHVILPVSPRMHARLTVSKEELIAEDFASQHQPRLQQMLLVLVSQRSNRSISFSLTASTPEMEPGEAAIQHLLRAIRTPLSPRNQQERTVGAPSFVSGGKPRDRRGRIATKQERRRSALPRFRFGEDDVENGIDEDGVETPRIAARLMGLSDLNLQDQADREFLESLRSPDPERIDGGWGLGAGSEEKKADEEDDDETMGWDEAQAAVERMPLKIPRPGNGGG